MRAVPLLLVLAGCDQHASPGPTPATATRPNIPPPTTGPSVERSSVPAASAAAPSTAPDATAVAAPPASPAPATARLDIEVPADLAAAPAWIGRTLHTGMIVPASSLETWTMQRVGDRALLTIERQTARNRMPDRIGPWSAKDVRRYLGTVTTARTTLTFTLSDGVETLNLVCSPTVVLAAQASAVRTPAPHKLGREECGNPGQWAPLRKKQLGGALRCRAPDAPKEDAASGAPDLRLAAAPGVEYLYVNDDCSMQGGGWREIPMDGSIAPAR